MFYDILFGRLTTIDHKIVAHCITIMNRADPDFIKSNTTRMLWSRDTYEIPRGMNLYSTGTTRFTLNIVPI